MKRINILRFYITCVEKEFLLRWECDTHILHSTFDWCDTTCCFAVWHIVCDMCHHICWLCACYRDCLPISHRMHIKVTWGRSQCFLLLQSRWLPWRLFSFFCLLQELQLQIILKPTVVSEDDVEPCQAVVEKHADTGWASSGCRLPSGCWSPQCILQLRRKILAGWPAVGESSCAKWQQTASTTPPAGYVLGDAPYAQCIHFKLELRSPILSIFFLEPFKLWMFFYSTFLLMCSH